MSAFTIDETARAGAVELTLGGVDALGELLLVDRADDVPDDAAVGGDEVGLGEPGDAPGALGVVARVAHVREREPELRDEVARVLAGVLGVEAEEQHAVAGIRLPGLLEQLRLGAARVAP